MVHLGCVVGADDGEMAVEGVSGVGGVLLVASLAAPPLAFALSISISHSITAFKTYALVHNNPCHTVSEPQQTNHATANVAHAADPKNPSPTREQWHAWPSSSPCAWACN